HALATAAATLRPDELRRVANRLDGYLNPDGDYDEHDRARKRFFHMDPQGPDKMTSGRFCVEPELAAYLEAIFAKWAKPGACHPDDEHPAVDEEPSEDAVKRDRRTTGQRQHDALKALCRAMLASGQLGQHRGLPVTVIVSTTLKELQDATGHAVTGGGALLPIRDLIRLAGHAHHYLVLFDDHGRPLYLGRSKRIASPDQRIVLHAKDRGCTAPGCAAAGYRCQVHHLAEWADGGPTDIDQLTFACDTHHRDIDTENGWQTIKDPKTGRTLWIPPAILDPNQLPRRNNYHHPGEYLTTDDDPDDQQRRAG
ncbi:DUF222 domain-containing protein, partial [Skermania sp. ID1734]|uniref:HNH endonuclease signature motif containing protein n=1 Tax=Skermania sp. ID1734 TaxID=2597516 RepID=UPI00117CF7F0